MQRSNHIGDVLGPRGYRVGAADAGLRHVDITAKPNRSEPENCNTIVRAVREFDGPLLTVDLQIMPIASWDIVGPVAPDPI